MLDTDRQLPSPSATAWSLDLTGFGGPLFVILATEETVARQILVEHLVELGKAATPVAGATLIADVAARNVSVLW